MTRPRMIPFLFPVVMAVLTLATPVVSHALVDMKNSNYTDQWVDINLSGSGYALRVNRAYNSRSVFNGIFGFGWCSDFETVLERLPEGRLKLTECGAGQEVFYTPGKYDAKAFDKLIADYPDQKELVAAARQQNPAGLKLIAPPYEKPNEKRRFSLTQNCSSICLRIVSRKVMSSPLELPHPLFRPSGATKMALFCARALRP